MKREVCKRYYIITRKFTLTVIIENKNIAEELFIFIFISAFFRTYKIFTKIIFLSYLYRNRII